MHFWLFGEEPPAITYPKNTMLVQGWPQKLSGQYLLMDKILHQLMDRLVDYPIIFKPLYIPGGAGILP